MKTINYFRNYAGFYFLALLVIAMIIVTIYIIRYGYFG